jgi:hypothetical protein
MIVKAAVALPAGEIYETIFTKPFLRNERLLSG